MKRRKKNGRMKKKIDREVRIERIKKQRKHKEIVRALMTKGRKWASGINGRWRKATWSQRLRFPSDAPNNYLFVFWENLHLGPRVRSDLKKVAFTVTFMGYFGITPQFFFIIIFTFKIALKILVSDNWFSNRLELSNEVFYSCIVLLWKTTIFDASKWTIIGKMLKRSFQRRLICPMTCYEQKLWLFENSKHTFRLQKVIIFLLTSI